MAKNIADRYITSAWGDRARCMAFVHPNPMDQSCWIFQLAHMSTWFRCIAIDMPGLRPIAEGEHGLDNERHRGRAAGRRSTRWLGRGRAVLVG